MFDRQRYEPKRVVLATLRAIVRDLDPTLVSPADAVELLDWFTAVERLAVAGKTLLAARAAGSDAWRHAGERSPADWLAKQTGSSVADARSVLETSAALADAPATDAALRAGALSARQAAAVAPAAAADPSAEGRLLEIAGHQALKKLEDECARVRAAADPDPGARRERIHKQRSFRTFHRADGSHGGTFTGTPEDIARFKTQMQPFIDARLDEARRNGERESSDAYAFDGLMAMADFADAHLYSTAPDVSCGPQAPDAPTTPAATDIRNARGGRGRKRLGERRELIAIVNLESLRRGHLDAGELCEIPGIGPIDLETARELFGDALLRVVIRDGKNIHTVVHTGRTASELQATAVFVRQLGRCGNPECGNPISEIDHTDDYTDFGPATIDGEVGFCGRCHDLKTNGRYTYRREADGTVTWIRPDGTEARERPPPDAAA